MHMVHVLYRTPPIMIPIIHTHIIMVHTHTDATIQYKC